ncbi:MAG: hypothetical protein ACE14T_11215 [Syntrophales bacterium]
MPVISSGDKLRFRQPPRRHDEEGLVSGLLKRILDSVKPEGEQKAALEKKKKRYMVVRGKVIRYRDGKGG